MSRNIKSGFLDKVIERFERIEPGEVQSYLVRLVQEKGFFEQVFDVIQEGVIVVNLDGVITYVNRAACSYFGLVAEEAIDERIEEQLRGLEWDVLIGEGKVVSRDLEVFYPENRYLNFYLSPIEAPDLPPELNGYVMIVRDITQTRKLAEEQMETEKLNALTMLAAGVAHEIGNPLNSLNIHLQLLNRQLRKQFPQEYEESFSEMLDVARGEISRLDSIIESFLGAIRPNTPNLEYSDMNAILREAVDFLSPELGDRGLDIKTELRSDLPLIELDRNQIKQAFYNLLKNASQSVATKQGALTIRTDMDDDEYTVSFIDNGKGISSEEMGNIFKPYYTTKRSGSGLGLLIVRRIVREHGGEIEIQSEQGVGTEVTIHFPRVTRGVRMLPDSREEEKPKTKRKRRVARKRRTKTQKKEDVIDVD